MKGTAREENPKRAGDGASPAGKALRRSPRSETARSGGGAASPVLRRRAVRALPIQGGQVIEPAQSGQLRLSMRVVPRMQNKHPSRQIDAGAFSFPANAKEAIPCTRKYPPT